MTTAADSPDVSTLLMSLFSLPYVNSGGTFRFVPPLLSHVRLFAARGDAYDGFEEYYSKQELEVLCRLQKRLLLNDEPEFTTAPYSEDGLSDK